MTETKDLQEKLLQKSRHKAQKPEKGEELACGGK